MKKVVISVAVLALGLVGIASTAGSAEPPTILKASTMVGVTGPYVGTAIPATPIRGVNGGGIPWNISDAKAVLLADGHLEIKVEGLVLATTGMNPVNMFRGLVSCQTISGTTATVTNVSTDPFPATMTGNSKIAQTLDLPDPCIAPIVFVTSPTGSWFAATGV
jgi:hypothetical protein